MGFIDMKSSLKKGLFSDQKADMRLTFIGQRVAKKLAVIPTQNEMISFFCQQPIFQ